MWIIMTRQERELDCILHVWNSYSGHWQRNTGSCSHVRLGVQPSFGQGALLGPLSSSDSLWRARRLQADLGRQLNGVSSDTLVWLASGLSGRVLRSVVRRVMFLGAYDSTFASQACWGVRDKWNWGYIFLNLGPTNLFSLKRWQV